MVRPSNDVMFDLSDLPKFPCARKDKNPLTKHGFYDAKVDMDDRGWPLVGVPTGQGTWDVLDIDNVEWLEQNINRLGVTRCHQTRRGGWHFLYRHHPGLGCSTDRVAKAVDVRSEGGYSIWWPREGLRVVNADRLEHWPEWLLPLALGHRRERTSGRKGMHMHVMIDGPLKELSVLDYQNYDDWRNLMMGAHEAGITREEWIRWSTRDPDYADAGEEIGRLWDGLKGDRITGWWLRVEIRLAQLKFYSGVSLGVPRQSCSDLVVSKLSKL
jgi:Bifunctional DNA primase/polymerase, N-terminal/Primase C terminal 2 (PriCT-2)